MIMNPDEYKNYILIVSNDPTELSLPTPDTKIGYTFEIKGIVVITQPAKHVLPIDAAAKNPGLKLSRSFDAMGEKG